MTQKHCLHNMEDNRCNEMVGHRWTNSESYTMQDVKHFEQSLFSVFAAEIVCQVTVERYSFSSVQKLFV